MDDLQGLKNKQKTKILFCSGFKTYVIDVHAGQEPQKSSQSQRSEQIACGKNQRIVTATENLLVLTSTPSF